MILMAHLGRHGYEGHKHFTSADLHDPVRWAVVAENVRLALINWEDAYQIMFNHGLFTPEDEDFGREEK